MRIGFLGLGRMGEPMAANLVRAGHDLVVWNRSAPSRERLQALGARAAATPWEVLRDGELTIEMLSSEAAIVEALGVGQERFAQAVTGRGLVHMSTMSPEASQRLRDAVCVAGGWYVEAPVSGSRVPAEQARLVAMVAGDADHVTMLEPVLDAMCGLVLRCGAVPSASRMKLAVNTFLIGLVTSLAEAWHFAESLALDGDVFAAAITSGQMSSPIAAVKLDKLRRADFTPQAAIPDVHRNAQLIAEAASARGIAIPVHQTCLDLLTESVAFGDVEADMVAVLHAIERRSAAVPESVDVSPETA